jgi:hypothetical protein
MSFYGLDMTQEEALADLEKVKKFGSRDGRVCVCGHGLGYHAFIDGRGVYKCNAQKQTCPCKNPRPVLTTDNVKAFLFKTHGSAGLHALGQGIANASKNGNSVEWIIDLVCDRCGAENVVPCPVNQNGIVMFKATGYDKLLCRDCRLGK